MRLALMLIALLVIGMVVNQQLAIKAFSDNTQLASITPD